MHYRELCFGNIKGCSGVHHTPPLAIVSGPNGSGKSAFLEAMRLAATGRCSIGAAKPALAKLASGVRAVASLVCEDGTQCTWAMSIGDSISTTWEAPDMQGGMPVTVRDMWNLTEEQRLSLVGGKDALEANETRALSLRERLKTVKQALDVPQPAAPPPYMGPPTHQVDEEVIQLTLRIEQHKRNTSSYLAHVQQATQLKELRDTLSRDLAMYTDSMARLERERDEALPVFQAYNAAMKAVPPILSHYSNFGDMLSAATEALVWLRHTTGMEIGVEIEMLRQIDIDCDVPPVRFERSEDLYAVTGPSPDKWMCHIEDEINRGQRAVSTIKEELRKIQEDMASHGGTSPDDNQLALDVARLDELKKLSMAAHEWWSFEMRTGEWAVHRSKMVSEHDKISQELDELRMERAAIVSKLKSSIEARANDMLSRAGMAPLEIDVATTAKRAALRVSVAGVAIEALAASELLLYGLCLLSAIHQASNAMCPLMVAECAEMDEEMFQRAVAALGTPEKGNIVLEHWLGTDGSIAMGEAA